jgi:broad specificity phosphatase PhoE
MKNIFIVRHGEILANRERRYAGWSDEELTAMGIEQAQETAERLRRLEVSILYTSPIKRAVQTAEIIGRALKLNPIVEQSITELQMGPWEGKSENEIEIEFKTEWLIWNTKPAELRLQGRETLSELLERSMRGVENMIFRANTLGKIAAVTHVAIIRILFLYKNNIDINSYRNIHVPNTSIFDYNAGRFL